jgi:hypothetical protein
MRKLDAYLISLTNITVMTCAVYWMLVEIPYREARSNLDRQISVEIAKVHHYERDRAETELLQRLIDETRTDVAKQASRQVTRFEISIASDRLR